MRTVLPWFLVGLVIVLGVLQWRWLGEIARDERQRMRATLTASVEGVARDVDRELGLVYAGLQASNAAEQEGAAYAAQWNRWVAGASTPSLVTAVYLVTFEADNTTRVRHFDRARASFDDVPWPRELANVQRKVNAASPRVAWIDETVPAIVAPNNDVRVLEGTSPEALIHHITSHVMTTRPTKRGATIVVLDRRVLATELLPRIVKRYFPAGDYDVSIVTKANPNEVVFRTGAVTKHADATHDLFSIRPADIALRGAIGVRAEHVVSTTFLAPTTTRSRTFFGRQLTVGDPRWQLRVTHRAGSLDAVVSRARMRNLAIGFTILTVLAVSIVFTAAAARRAERLARQQIEFVAAVSHELRTPLATICSAGDNLANGVITAPERVREYGSVLRHEGARLADMVEQVLEFARTESAPGRYAARRVDVADVIERTVAATKHLDDVALHVDVAHELPRVDGDPAALARAVQNLVSNAAKYSTKPAEIELVARGIDGVVEIAVLDRGDGIDDDDLPHLFEPFFRGRKAVDSQIAGSGLGLTLVQRIVHAHGGSVAVTPRDGGGSIFAIRLPAAA